jgi:uncharacterized protein YciI
MLFVWIGFLKPEVAEVPQSVQRMATDFLSQPSIKIRSAGPLRDAGGKRSAMMMVFEHDDLQAAESFVRDSPYLEAELYDDHHLYQYDNEVG